MDAEQRYRRLFDDYHRAIYAYCRRRTDAQTAADCASESLLVAWRRMYDPTLVVMTGSHHDSWSEEGRAIVVETVLNAEQR